MTSSFSRARRWREHAAWLLALLVIATGCVRTGVIGSECDGFRSCWAEKPGGLQTAAHDADIGATASMDASDGSLQPAEPADAGSCPGGDADLCACEGALPASALAHWRLDETSGVVAMDATGHGFSGKLVQFPTDPWTQGTVGGALRFDGVANSVQVGRVTGAVKTLTFWIKPGTTSVTTDHTPLLFPSAHGPLDEWSNPENAYAQDGKDATAAALVLTSVREHWGGFQIPAQLPANANVLGIAAAVDTGNLGLLGYFGVELSWDGGSSHTHAQYTWAQLLAGSNLQQAGGSDKLWGRAWALSDFSDANFRVKAAFGGIANTMAVDYLALQLYYAAQATPRMIMRFSSDATLGFSGASDGSLAIANWPHAQVYVNGVLGGPVTAAWNQVVVTSTTALDVSDLRLGGSAGPSLTFLFQGLLDDVRVFEAPLSAAQVRLLHDSPACLP